MADRLSLDAKKLIELATAEAVKRNHEEIRPEHALLGALALPATLGVFAERALDLTKFRALLDARLGVVEPSSAYRDGSANVRMSAAFNDALAVASRRRLLLWIIPRQLRSTDLVAAMFEAGHLANLADEAKIDLAPIQRLFDGANRAARERGHGNVLVAHALIALFADDPTFGAAVRALGHEPKAVERRLEDLLREGHRSHRIGPFAGWVKLAVLRAAVSSTEVGVGTVVVDLLRHASARNALEAVDVNRYDLLFAYVHGRAPAPSTVDRSEGEVDVVFYDDPYTTMEIVMEVLKDAFGMSEPDAKRAMLAVHEHGSAVVLTLRRDLAMAATISARGTARDELMPLRIELVEKT